MKVILVVISVLASIYSLSANAGRTKGQVTSILVNSSVSKVVHLRVEGTTTGRKDCQTHSVWNYVFDGTTDAGKLMVSIALAAHFSKKEVVVESNPSTNCDLRSGFETIEYIYTNTDESII